MICALVTGVQTFALPSYPLKSKRPKPLHLTGPPPAPQSNLKEAKPKGQKPNRQNKQISKYAVDQKVRMPKHQTRPGANSQARRPRIPSKSTMSNSKLELEPRKRVPLSKVPAPQPTKKRNRARNILIMDRHINARGSG